MNPATISSIENYKAILQKEEICSYIKNYIQIIQDFVKHSHEDLNIEQNEYMFYIIKQGISTLYHVSNFIMMYTKNKELVLYHLQKCLYYYVEFINQMIRENQNFLQFTTKDAILFIYKKTIFDIDQEYIKLIHHQDLEKQYMQYISNCIEYYNTIIEKILYKHIHDIRDKRVITDIDLFHETLLASDNICIYLEGYYNDNIN